MIWNILILNVYTPTEEKSDDEKDIFYEALGKLNQ